MSTEVNPGRLFAPHTATALFRQRFTPRQAGLHWLACGEWQLPPGGESAPTARPGREALLFQWKASSAVSVAGARYQMAPYDVLYIPREAPFTIEAGSSEPASLIECSADAARTHPVFHARFAEISQREDRVRRLKGKNVYLMFDVSEPADKLVAGYTFFEPYARSWPPHNHTDQEEAYIFINGRGAMEVYESDEKLTFVHSVSEGDVVTIPFLNYHPVFSQQEPLEFIWCIAGARYWVGDKNKDFLTGNLNRLTT